MTTTPTPPATAAITPNAATAPGDLAAEALDALCHAFRELVDVVVKIAYAVMLDDEPTDPAPRTHGNKS